MRLAVSRPASNAERDLLTKLLEQHRDAFQSDTDAAADALEAGLSKPPAELDTVELAAWTSVARAILNLNETITRN